MDNSQSSPSEISETLREAMLSVPVSAHPAPHLARLARVRVRRRRAAIALTGGATFAAVGIATALQMSGSLAPARSSVASQGDCSLSSPFEDSTPGFVSQINAPHPDYPNGMSIDQAKRSAVSHATGAVGPDVATVVQSRADQAQTVIGPLGAASNLPVDRCVYTVTVRAPGLVNLSHPVVVPSFSVVFDVATGAQLAVLGSPPVR
jgi:hypothetical protein